jgi:hypothetical protein
LKGGGDYRGIYDTGFKGAFMGYIGLLLNAPYKIDSMVWMRIEMSFLIVFFVVCCVTYGGQRNLGRSIGIRAFDIEAILDRWV